MTRLLRSTIAMAFLAALFSLTGCVTVPSPSDDAATLKRLGYGGPAPEHWQESARTFVLERLKDPDSAKFKFSEEAPKQFWAREAPLLGRHFASGYLVECMVNAKNSYGGYVGFTPYRFIFRDGEIIAYETTTEGRYGAIASWYFLPACPVY